MKSGYAIPISVKGIVFEGDAVWVRKNERKEWELPGGKLDEGEQPEQTVIREMKEELGFAITVNSLIQAHVSTIKHSLDESRGILALSYLCTVLNKTGTFELQGEAGIAVFQKFTIKEIATLPMPDFYKDAIHLAWKIKAS